MDGYGGADLRKKGGKSSGLQGWDAKTAQGVGEKHCDVGGRTRNSPGWTALGSRNILLADERDPDATMTMPVELSSFFRVEARSHGW